MDILPGIALLEVATVVAEAAGRGCLAKAWWEAMGKLPACRPTGPVVGGTAADVRGGAPAVALGSA